MLTKAVVRRKAQDPGFELRRGEICPGDQAVVLAPDRHRIPRAFVMRWGFRVLRGPASPLREKSSAAAPKQSTTLVFNTRSEQASQKPLFAESLKQRRCLIPCSAYFEWDHREKPAPKYQFRPQGSSLVLLCGIYRMVEGQPEFSVLTRDAAPSIACFHDRMPVILPPAMARGWLDLDASVAELLSGAVTDVSFQPWLTDRTDQT